MKIAKRILLLLTLSLLLCSQMGCTRSSGEANTTSSPEAVTETHHHTENHHEETHHNS